MRTAWTWKYFEPHEVLSPEGLKWFRKGVLWMQPHMLDSLCDYRLSLNDALLINHGGAVNRGFRTAQENQRVKGERLSCHVQGVAADITAQKTPLEVLLVKAVRFGWTGIGVYPSKNFIHHDKRTLLHTDCILWNGDNKASTIIDERALKNTDKALALLLKSALQLPETWYANI